MIRICHFKVVDRRAEGNEGVSTIYIHKRGPFSVTFDLTIMVASYIYALFITQLKPQYKQHVFFLPPPARPGMECGVLHTLPITYPRLLSLELIERWWPNWCIGLLQEGTGWETFYQAKSRPKIGSLEECTLTQGQMRKDNHCYYLTNPVLQKTSEPCLNYSVSEKGFIFSNGEMSISLMFMQRFTLPTTGYDIIYAQTDVKLIFVPLDKENHQYKSISICVEAIQNPQIDSYEYSVPNHLLEFDVCLDHGASTAQRHADSCKTVGELFGQGRHETPSHLPAYRSCRVRVSVTMIHDRSLAVSIVRQGRRCFWKGSRS